MIAAAHVVVAPVGLMLVGLWLAYELGARRVRECGGDGRERSAGAREAWLFRSGVLMGVGLVCSPLGGLADDQLFARALVDVGLAWVVAPLLVLGAPAPAFLALLGRWRETRAIVGAARWPAVPANEADTGPRWPVFGQPVIGVAALLGAFWVWHVPSVLDASVGSAGLQSLAFGCYLAGGVLWWAEMVGSYPFQPRLSHLGRSGLIVAAFAGYWGLGAALVYSGRSWYPAFGHGAGAVLPAVMSQEYAGAFFWALPSIPLGVASFWCFSRWLEGESAEEERFAAYLARLGSDRGEAGQPRAS